MEGMNRRLSNDTFEDFHTSNFIRNRKPLAVSFQFMNEYGFSIAFERLWGVPSILTMQLLRKIIRI